MRTIRDDTAERRRLRALILAEVNLRFAVAREEFVTRVQDLARRHSPTGTLPSLLGERLSLDDLYLATACAQGDENAWAEFIAKHRDFIHRFARRVLKQPEATDLADEVIADLRERGKIARYEGRSSLRTWLGTVVAHAAINARRAARSRENQAQFAMEFRRAGPNADIDDAERSNELAGLLAESIARQPVRDQLLVLLYYEQSLTLDQIASVMSLSKAALSRRLKRFREAVLETVDALARRRLGTSARSLVDGLELSKIELDLRTACAATVERNPTDLF